MTYPERGGTVLAILDTGYTGFLYVPKEIFNRIKLDELKAKKLLGYIADGKSVKLWGALGTVSFPALELDRDGFIETSEGESEILIGMDGIRNLVTEIDCCERLVSIQLCR